MRLQLPDREFVPYREDYLASTLTLRSRKPSLENLPVANPFLSKYLCSMDSRLCPFVSTMKNAQATVQNSVENAKK